MSWLTIFVGAIALVGLGYLVWWDAMNPQVSMLTAFAAAQIPSALTVLLIAFRTSALSGWAVALPLALRANSLAISGTAILPARLSELGKPLHFRAICGFPAARGLALVIEERIWDFVGLGLVIVATLILGTGGAGSAALQSAAWIVGVCAVFGLLVLLVLPRVVRHLPVLGRLDAEHGIFRKRTLAGMLGTLGLSALIWAMSVLILAAAYRFSGLPALDPGQILLLFAISTLGLAISVTPGSLGTYEASIVGTLALYEVGWDAALAFAIGFRLCWMAVPILLALITLRIDGPALIQARRARSAAP